MGVHNLWELLAPVGRRVSVETLAGKKLAIDASIWMIQFMKAMRDEKGEMMRNAHILGFFRRICKLLFLRTKPVFVFDGGTPALKRRTVVARRRQRENAQTKIRKTAEKLLLNHLKAMRLKELADDLEKQRLENDAKGKKGVMDQSEIGGNNLEGTDSVLGSYNQEALDEMLAASLAAEEDGSFTASASTTCSGIPAEEEDGDEDEEMILPTIHGKVDPAVLAALPPSMQLDLLVQMRERLMAENRQKYQKVKQAPAKFSELQIQAYLKTVAFRREIDEVQRSAAGRGVGGVQTSRIASESNREFIFSSSFTGDKQVLTSAGVERSSDKQHQMPTGNFSSNSRDSVASTNKSNAAPGSVVDEPRTEFDDGVETYMDESGRLRVSRVRAMGIRMTRDLQRNLDLIKEIEQERTSANKVANDKLVHNKNISGAPRRFPSKIQFLETSNHGDDGNAFLNDRNEESMSKTRTSIEISFEDASEHKCLDGEDDLFARLVAGDHISLVGDTSSKKQSNDSASDCDWEEGVAGEKGNNLTFDLKVGNNLSLAEEGNNDESEVEWEEGLSDVPKCATSGPAENRETVSIGVLEEEADFQEAIRRSLDDLKGQKSIDVSSEDDQFQGAREMANEGTSNMPLYKENDRGEAAIAMQPNESSCEIVAVVERPDIDSEINTLKTNNFLGRHLAPSIAVNPDNVDVVIDKLSERYLNSHPEHLRQDACTSGNLHRETGPLKSVNTIKEKGVHLVGELLLDTSNDISQTSTSANGCTGVSSDISDSLLVDVPDIVVADVKQNDFEPTRQDHSTEKTEQGKSSVKESRADIDAVQKLAEDRSHGELYKENDDIIDISAFKDNKEQLDVTEASLEEEMLILGKERVDLAEEQRKLERNVESVSSEMFAECQELLQMFGLPYIISPMEAEAQCAYMELANLVDGVVTDDSDAFLFGARSVYKNIFDDRKYVETYFMKDIENELGLTREKLIHMALLLGSDYTEGVSGIGIVNAIEVLNAFPEEDGLQKFREWIESPDPTILGKFNMQEGSSSRKRGSKVINIDTSCPNSNADGDSTSNHNVSHSMDSVQNTKQIFMDKHRNVSKNWHIPSSFPSEAVISAYVSPRVDNSTEPFSWGKPDLFVLRKLCWEKFGWGSQKADELLLPVLKEYNKHETQLRLEAFYTFNERFAKIRSKRIKKAVKGITGNKSLELMDESVQEDSKSRKKRRVSPNESGDDKSGKHLHATGNGVARDGSNTTEKLTAKQSRKRRTRGDSVLSEAGIPEPPMQTEGRQKNNKGSSARGRGRGKGRGRAIGRGRRKKNSTSEDAEISSNDGNSSDCEQELQVEKLEGSQEIRRSTRVHKAVKYILDDLEIDELGKLDQNDEHYSDEEAVEEEPFRDQDLVGDAAASSSGMKQHKVGDSLLKEGLCREYLEMGGGICMEEAEPETETGQLDSGQDGDPSFGVELSNEYLKMGGGFCLEEDEDPDICASSAAQASVFEKPNPSHQSGFMEEVDHNIGSVQLVSSPIKALDGLQNGGKTDASNSVKNLDHSVATTNNEHLKVDTSPQEFNKEYDSGMTPVSFLSAMPCLRRKRRKS